MAKAAIKPPVNAYENGDVILPTKSIQLLFKLYE